MKTGITLAGSGLMLTVVIGCAAQDAQSPQDAQPPVAPSPGEPTGPVLGFPDLQP